MAVAPRPTPRRRTRHALSSMPLRLIRKILDENSPSAFSSIPFDDLGEDEQAVYELIRRHYAQHAVFPTVQTLIERGVQLPDAPEPLTYYTFEFYNSIRVRRAAEMITELQAALQANDGLGAEQIIAQHRDTSENPAITITALGDRAEAFAERLSPTASIAGRISTGIPAIDETLGGTKRADVVFIAGRPGTGKTFTAIAAAMNLAEEGERVLFVSKEMTTEQVEDRMFTMLMDLDPSINVRRFSTTATQRVAEQRRADIPEAILRNLVFPNHDAIVTTADVEASIRRSRPSVCFIDGAYFLQTMTAKRGADEREVLTALIRELRAIAMRLRVTIFVMWQQNRSKTFGTEGLFGTDAASQDAALVLMLKKVRGHPDIRELFVVKNRHGPDEFSVGMGYGFKPTNVGELVPLPDDNAPGAESGAGGRRRRADSPADGGRGMNRHVQQAITQAQRGPSAAAPAASIPGDQ